MISPEKWRQLRNWMQTLAINEDALQEKFVIGSGRGGQKLQKTASCVALLHLPSGIQVKCQKSRSREDNRYFARYRLCEKIAAETQQEKTQKQQAIEKIRRQKRRRSRRAQEKILADKRKQSELKQLRKPPET